MYNGSVGLTKTGVDSVFDKILEIGKRQTKEKCLSYNTCEEKFFLSSISTQILSVKAKNSKMSIHLPHESLSILILIEEFHRYLGPTKLTQHVFLIDIFINSQPRKI